MAGAEAVGDREGWALADIPCAVIKCVAVGRGFTTEEDAVTPEHGEVVEVGDSLEEVAAVAWLQGYGVSRAVVDLRSVKLRRDLHRVEGAIRERHRDRDGCGIAHIIDRAAASAETAAALASGGICERTREEDFLYIHHACGLCRKNAAGVLSCEDAVFEDDIDAGEAIERSVFTQECGACHGDGAGGSPPIQCAAAAAVAHTAVAEGAFLRVAVVRHAVEPSNRGVVELRWAGESHPCGSARIADLDIRNRDRCPCWRRAAEGDRVRHRVVRKVILVGRDEISERIYLGVGAEVARAVAEGIAASDPAHADVIVFGAARARGKRKGGSAAVSSADLDRCAESAKLAVDAHRDRACDIHENRSSGGGVIDYNLTARACEANTRDINGVSVDRECGERVHAYRIAVRDCKRAVISIRCN